MKPLLIRKGSASVRLYRTTNKGRRQHQISWQHAGQRLRRTCKTLKEAKAEADRVLDTIIAGTPELATISRTDAQELTACREAIAPTGMPLFSIVREYMRTWQDTFKKATVKQCIADYRTSQNDESPKFQEDLRWRLAAFEKDFGSRYIDEITAKEVRLWIEARTWKGKTVGNRTRTNYLKLLQGLWAWAQLPEVAHLNRDLLHELKGMKHWKHRKARTSWIDTGEINLLLKACLKHKGRSQLIPYVALQLFAGLRSKEAMLMEYEDLLTDINPATGNSRVTGLVVGEDVSKTGNRRILEGFPSFNSMMNEGAIEQQGYGLICRWSKLPEILHQTAKEAGVDWRPNMLRHTFATHLLRLWQDQKKVAVYLGTSPEMLESQYKELIRDRNETKRFFAIGRWWDSEKPPKRVEGVF